MHFHVERVVLTFVIRSEISVVSSVHVFTAFILSSIQSRDLKASKMSSSTLLDVLGHVLFSFTRSVTDHYNPEEPEYTAESFGYCPLESTGREWYYQPVDELIYQEYSDREVTNTCYLAMSSLDVQVINACSTDENETTANQEQVDRGTAWKRLRPSVCRTVWQSMYIGALISLLAAIITGAVHMLISYLCYKTVNLCEFYSPRKLIPVPVQWMRTCSTVIAYIFLYNWFFSNALLLFRLYQLKGLKRKLILAYCIAYSLDAIYRVSLQAFGISFSKLSVLEKIPINVVFVTCFGFQVHLLASRFCTRLKRKISLFLQLAAPFFLVAILGLFFTHFIYPEYIKRDKEGKLLIAVFAPLTGVLLKPVSRICAQRLWNISHPGYSYVLLAPLYYGAAVAFRVLQADLGSLQSIAILGIIHGAAEVIERSTMVVIDHICQVLWKRKSAPWGSFRTPRRERLMADIAIMSMLSESAAIVAVNGVIFLYQWIYIEHSSLLELVQSFAVHTSVPLVIEWFFNSMSVAIETRYQNMPVMAVWRRRWKRHTLVAIVNTVPLALFLSNNLLAVVHELFNEGNFKQQPCKMPF
ncbi:uncharacterized protein LOC144649074 [Oculina patagonica]